MGADGGVKLTKMSDVRLHWSKIKDDLIERFDDKSTDSRWESSRKYAEKAAYKCLELPDNIDKLTNQEVVNLFDFLKHCDCPGLFLGEILITPVDENLIDPLNIHEFSQILPGEYFETWT